MQTFIEDLMSRRSFEAKLFRKTCKLYNQSMVISWKAKFIVLFGMLVINLCCALKSISFASNKAFLWQKGWIISSAVNFALDVMVIKTGVVIMEGFVIPNLIFEKVQSVKLVLIDIVNKICGGDIGRSVEFSAPEFLFVSSRVAKEFPTLVESLIVLSYSSPTLLASHGIRRRCGRNVIERICIGAQSALVEAPEWMIRLVIHFAIVIALAVLAYIGAGLCLAAPAAIVVLAFVMLVSAGVIWCRFNRFDHFSSDAKSTSILPVAFDTLTEKVIDTFQRDVIDATEEVWDRMFWQDDRARVDQGESESDESQCLVDALETDQGNREEGLCDTGEEKKGDVGLVATSLAVHRREHSDNSSINKKVSYTVARGDGSFAPLLGDKRHQHHQRNDFPPIGVRQSRTPIASSVNGASSLSADNSSDISFALGGQTLDVRTPFLISFFAPCY